MKDIVAVIAKNSAIEMRAAVFAMSALRIDIFLKTAAVN